VNRPRNRLHLRTGQRGLSLVELMVGITIGLFIVAAASLLLSNQLNDNRRLLLETQVQQDLRATADIVSRELRRAGYWGISESGVVNAAISGAEDATTNGFLVLKTATPFSVEYAYRRPNNDSGPYSFFLEGHVVKLVLSSSSLIPQDLTDINTLTVTNFQIIPGASTTVVLPCPSDCPTGVLADSCWPTFNVRDMTVVIEGEAPSDPTVKRRITTQVRLRNDALAFAPGTGAACPPL
jgi:prepilin-type N-terminal cleavage/methylation domain-containing protein